MNAVCPANNEHKEFEATAHVVQLWKVDAKGNFLESLQNLETTHGPNSDNTWYCTTCGAEAIVHT